MSAVDAAAVAKALNITPRRVQQLAREGLPRVARGRYELGACMAWYIRFLQRALEQRALPGESGGYLSLAAERARLAKEQADKAALDNAVRRGQLVEIRIASREWEKWMVTLRAHFLSTPNKLGSVLPDPAPRAVVVEKLRESIYEALRAAADGEIRGRSQKRSRKLEGANE